MFIYTPLTDAERAEVAAMIGVWFQVSRRHRHVARFPPGVAPKDALRQASMTHGRLPKHIAEWIDRLDEGSAGDQFLRVYATYRSDELVRVLTPAAFDAFRALGGDTYRSYRALRST